MAEEDELGHKPKRRGKVMSDYEKWEISQLIKSGESYLFTCSNLFTCCALELVGATQRGDPPAGRLAFASHTDPLPRPQQACSTPRSTPASTRRRAACWRRWRPRWVVPCLLFSIDVLRRGC